ncbi:hypothetical protein CEXT_737171 [Caerostris extrusa]|uniref:Uncharacterized protein n=1 Tax=Caerostris extrusa TaxID=172846 RepID=A0AAV4V278_CAEEX|nr:hypothetical protein CEXT_737171 [Caerostris extrusa]
MANSMDRRFIPSTLVMKPGEMQEEVKEVSVSSTVVVASKESVCLHVGNDEEREENMIFPSDAERLSPAKQTTSPEEASVRCLSAP